MKNKILFVLFLLLLLTGCGSNYKMDGKDLTFSKKYKDMFITYYYPEQFTEEKNDDNFNLNQTYEFYNNDKLSFKLRVEEHSLGLSFSAMEEDAKKLEKNSNYKDINHTVLKVNGKNLVRYSYRTSDEFGDNTLYYVYYGGYSYAGINEYIKIIFINVDGHESFEKAFLSTFKINK